MTDIPEVHPHLQNILALTDLASKISLHNELIRERHPDLPEVVAKQFSYMEEMIRKQREYIIDLNEVMMQNLDVQDKIKRRRDEQLKQRNEENERRKLAQRQSHGETYNPFTKD